MSGSERPTAVVVMGVSGSGKTTIAELLSERLGWPIAEADDFHSPANKAKMAAGVPLTDEDRGPWLASLRDWITAQRRDVLLTCSALKRTYRDVLREAEAEVLFLHLDGSPEQLRSRMEARREHFMPPALLDSQLATLEPLAADENGLVVGIDRSPEEIVAAMLAALDRSDAG